MLNDTAVMTFVKTEDKYEYSVQRNVTVAIGLAGKI